MRERVGKALRIASYVWAAITLPAWFLNSVAQLRLSLRLWQSLLHGVAPGVRAALLAVHNFVAPAVLGWRGVVEPLRVWVGAIVSLHLPHQFIEFLIAALPLVPAFIRYTVMGHVFGRAYDAYDAQVKAREPSVHTYRSRDDEVTFQRTGLALKNYRVAAAWLRAVVMLVLIVLVLDAIDYFWR